MPFGQQISGQARPKRAGSFNAKGFDMTEPGGPDLEIMIPFSRRGNARTAQTRAMRVDGDGNVLGFVRVDANNNLIHGRPFRWNGPSTDRRGQDC